MNTSRSRLPAAPDRASDDAVQSGLSRRQFVRYISAALSAIGLQACGGGGGGGSGAAAATAGSPPNNASTTPITSTTSTTSTTSSTSTAPVWTTVPDMTFTQGIASSVSIAPYVTGPSGAALTIALNTGAVPLPAGVSYNSATQSLDYDGVGAVASSSGHILTATD